MLGNYLKVRRSHLLPFIHGHPFWYRSLQRDWDAAIFRDLWSSQNPLSTRSFFTPLLSLPPGPHHPHASVKGGTDLETGVQSSPWRGTLFQLLSERKNKRRGEEKVKGRMNALWNLETLSLSLCVKRIPLAKASRKKFFKKTSSQIVTKRWGYKEKDLPVTWQSLKAVYTPQYETGTLLKFSFLETQGVKRGRIKHISAPTERRR